jgi:uncharacterized membrane protein
MTKRNWDITLIQETGLIKNKTPHQSTHNKYRHLNNKIIFNSPNQNALNLKRQKRKRNNLHNKLLNGEITSAQHDLEINYSQKMPKPKVA